MEPQIRYVRSADGTSIAAHRLGEGGVPLIVVPALVNLGTFNNSWQVPDIRAGYMALASKRRVVGYDTRGQGLSDRDVSDFSLDARVADLRAIVDAASEPLVDLLAIGTGALSGVRFAAERPDCVRKLILWHGVARTRDMHMDADRRALSALIDVNWDLYLQAMTLVDFGWEEGRLVAKRLSENVSRDAITQSWSAARGLDVTDALPMVRCATLVVYVRGAKDASLDAARVLARGIPNAQFQIVESTRATASAMFMGLVDTHIAVIEDFLSERHPEWDRAGTGTAIILFADIADSTALTERLGDAAFREKARELDEALRRAITSNGGTAIEGKLLGDGVLATFGAAREAIACALACHELAGSRATGQGPGPDDALWLHVGIHAGDVIRESNNVYGGAVNIAARVASEAAAGETLVSATVRELARTSAGVAFEDRGERELKGVGEPVRLYEVRWREAD